MSATANVFMLSAPYCQGTSGWNIALGFAAAMVRIFSTNAMCPGVPVAAGSDT